LEDYSTTYFPTRKRRSLHYINRKSIPKLIKVYKDAFEENSGGYNVLRLKYEDILKDPLTEVEKIAYFVECTNEEMIFSASKIVKRK
jgi:hypothetical protein